MSHFQLQPQRNAQRYPDGIRVPAIVDIEASGFSPHSYPIEVGVALGSGERFSRLIRPYPNWTHWDQEAEAVHGIHRKDLLRHGKPGEQVVAELNQWLAGKTLYSDGWISDKPWLIKLFEQARVSMEFWLSPLEMILTPALIEQWPEAERLAYERIDHQRHRASVDAFRIQQSYVNAQLLAKGLIP